MGLRFFIGMHQPNDARTFVEACISINRVWGRKKPVPNVKVQLDSGAFKELEQFGKYRNSEAEYAIEVFRLQQSGVLNLEVVVAQDYMCEPFMLEKTGMTVKEHQRLTIERYDNLMIAFNLLYPKGIPFEVMPVLQGFDPEEYADHVRQYDDRLYPGMWVGVGSVCKRQGKPQAILDVLNAIRKIRPDLRLHGFGVKKTSLKNKLIRAMLYSADSMAWSFAARKQGRNQNDPLEAHNFVREILEAA